MGRDLSKDSPTDSTAALILNEAAVRQSGWTDPIGKHSDLPGQKRRGMVIGVVQDFHLRSLYERVGPVALCMWLPKWYKLSLEIRTGKIPATVAFLRIGWE
jgi:putative ABC transport system permease protein